MLMLVSPVRILWQIYTLTCCRGNNENSVSVAGADCTIIDESSTEIICETNEPALGSQKTHVLVQVDDSGVSMKVSGYASCCR